MACCRRLRRGNRRTDSGARREGRRLPRLRSRCSCRLRLGGRHRVLGQPLLQRIDVLKQPGAGETQEVKAELRALYIELLDLVVADAEDDTTCNAFQRL